MTSKMKVRLSLLQLRYFMHTAYLFYYKIFPHFSILSYFVQYLRKLYVLTTLLQKISHIVDTVSTY